MNCVRPHDGVLNMATREFSPGHPFVEYLVRKARVARARGKCRTPNCARRFSREWSRINWARRRRRRRRWLLTSRVTLMNPLPGCVGQRWAFVEWETDSRLSRTSLETDRGEKEEAVGRDCNLVKARRIFSSFFLFREASWRLAFFARAHYMLS